MMRLVAFAFAGFLSVWSSVCTDKREVVFNTDDYLAVINLARTASLGVSLPVVEATKERETYINAKIKSVGKIYTTALDTNCTLGSGVSPFTVGGFVLRAGGINPPDPITFARLLQQEMDEALKLIGDKYQEKLSPYNSDIYNNWAPQNLGFLMKSTATKVTCGSPSNCKNGQSVVFCVFDEEPKEVDPPFSKELLSAMQARRAAKVDIAELFGKQTKTGRNLTGAEGSASSGASRAVSCALAVLLSVFAVSVAY